MGSTKATALQVLIIGLTTSTAAKRWGELLPSGSLPGRHNHVAVFDSKTGTMLVFGGQGASGYLGDLHRYTVQTNSWTALSPSGNAPPARKMHKAVFDSRSRAMLVFGGYDGADFSDLHRYDVQANVWSALSPSGSVPGARRMHSAVFDATARTMLIFGGWGGFSDLNDVHSYSVYANAWTALSPNGSAPLPRNAHTAVLDPTSRTMLVFSGWGAGWLNDLHGYDVQANAWSALSPSGSVPSPRSDHTAVWDSASGLMLVFGGSGKDGSYNDLHSYDAQANAWNALSPSGTLPSERVYHTAVVDSASRTMLLFGGLCCHLDDLHALELSDTTAATGTTTTITTTMTMKACDPGSEPSGEEHCKECAPGRFGAGGQQTCVACASGHDSEANSSNCQPTLGHVVGTLAEPVLTTSRISSTAVKLDVALAALPQDVFNVQALSYVVDIAQTAAALSAQSACTAKWEVSEDAASVQLNFTELSHLCSTSVSNTDSGIRRDGVLGVHLLAERNGSTEVAVVWLQDLTLTFNPHTDASQGGTVVLEVITLDAHIFHVGDFTSTLQLFTSDDFTTVKRLPLLREYDIAHVEHALEEDDGSLRMELAMAWLSRSSNVSDIDAVEHNLTSTLVQHDGGNANSLRYSFSPRACQSCHLHSLAKVLYGVDGRRLESMASFTVQSLYLEVGANAVNTTLPQVGANAVNTLPHVILGPAVALSLSAVVAVTTGIIVGLWSHRVHHEAFRNRHIQGCLMWELCDFLCGLTALVLVRAEGGLHFSNDGGAVFVALITCVGLGAFLFATEVGFCAHWGTQFSEAQKKTIHTVLACAHLAMEDAFQTVLYAFVAASHTRSGLGLSASMLVAVLQAVVFTMARIAEAAGMLQLRRSHRGAAASAAATPPAALPAKPACGGVVAGSGGSSCMANDTKSGADWDACSSCPGGGAGGAAGGELSI